MRRSVATLLCALLVAAPALADPADPAPGAAAKPKTKKVCHAADSGNPLFPTVKCRLVPIETAAAAEPAAPVEGAATQVALARDANPR